MKGETVFLNDREQARSDLGGSIFQEGGGEFTNIRSSVSG